jgi:hypothetical protein
MPVAINIAANLIFGASIAWVARRSETLQEHWLNWSSLLLCAFEAVLITPTTTYLFRFYPHWSTFYLFDPKEFPAIQDWLGWLSLMVIALNFIAALTGYLITRRGILKESFPQTILPILGGCLIITGLSILLYERVFFLGEYDAFWEGETSMLLGQAPGIVGILLYLVSAGFVVWIHLRYGEQEPKFF